LCRLLELFHQLFVKQIVRALLRAVAGLVHAEELPHGIDKGPQLLDAVKVMEEMIQHEQEVLLPQVGRQFLAIGSQILNLPVLSFAVAVNPEVDGVLKLRQVSRDFLSQDEVRQITQPVQQVEAPLNRVVIRDGHQIHPSPFGLTINVQRPGVTVEAPEEAEVLGGAGIPAVDV